MLVVGAGNSGGEIAIEVVEHPTWLAGKESGHVPFRIESGPARRLPTADVPGHRPPGADRADADRAQDAPQAPLPRSAACPCEAKDIAAAGIERVPRVVGVRDGLPLLEDGRILEAANVIWCTGFRRTSPGSTSLSSATWKSRSSRSITAGSSPGSRVSTSSGSSSSTRCRPIPSRRRTGREHVVKDIDSRTSSGCP